MGISDIIIYGVPALDEEYATFDFNAPDNREFCVTYRLISGDPFDIRCYVLDHVNKWRDQGGRDIKMEDALCSDRDARESIESTGYSLEDLFDLELSKNYLSLFLADL